MAQVRIINNNWYNNIIGKYVENLFSYHRNIIKFTTFKHLQLFDQKRQQLQIVGYTLINNQNTHLHQAAKTENVISLPLVYDNFSEKLVSEHFSPVYLCLVLVQ